MTPAAQTSTSHIHAGRRKSGAGPARENAGTKPIGPTGMAPVERPGGSSSTTVETKPISIATIATHQPLFGHDLEELQDGGVLGGFAGGDDLMDIADGGRAAAPKGGEDIELGVGGAGERGHLRRDYYEALRMSREEMREGWPR